MVLLFRPGSKVLASKWPCPKAKEGLAGCKKRFWSDGEKRRTDRLAEEERKFEKTHDTFGCRFYQRLSSNSPCDRTLSSIRIRLYDLEGKFVARAPFQFTVGSAKPVLGTASNEGEFVLRDVELPNRLVINWGFEPAKGKGPDLVFASDMFVTISDASTEQTGADGSFPEEFKQKLHNLGYPRENPETANVKAFQQDFGHLAETGVQPNGELNDATAKLIRDVFRTCADDLRNMAPKA